MSRPRKHAVFGRDPAFPFALRNDGTPDSTLTVQITFVWPADER